MDLENGYLDACMIMLWCVDTEGGKTETRAAAFC